MLYVRENPQLLIIQECIPVVCVPPTAVPVSRGAASVHAGIPPRCGPGDPLTRPSSSPLGVGLETPLARPLNLPPGCGSGDPPGQTPQAPPWVWVWRPAKHAGIPPPRDLQQGMLGYHLQSMLGYHPPCGQTDTCKNITFSNYVCGW